MQKHIWHKTQLSLKCKSQPIPRWGHSCCVIQNQVVFFGGYADSNYMNDVWSFNTTTMQWKQIKTTGEIPSNRSNCSMNYDKENNQIIIFGGGGPDKKRFNSINILDWKTKDWMEIHPKQNQSAPWERTYHSADLYYPYLVVYGGECVNDMEDLWVYNFLTLSWTQVNIHPDKPRPCARRFHSSVIVGKQLFIIAGCHSKYRPLNDVFSMDLTPLIQEGNTKKLQWKQRKFKGSTFLTRWGQSSCAYDNKIYIFGGRFSNDLNDILVIDLERQTIKSLKTGAEVPKPRRRHCATFVGSCLLVFGGFNGEYFNDLHYINVFQLRSKFSTQTNNRSLMNMYYFNNQNMSDHTIKAYPNGQLPIHKGILINCFDNQKSMEQFLSEIDGKLTKDILMESIKTLYQGYGKMPDNLGQKFKIKLWNDQEERQLEYNKQIQKQIGKNQSILGKKSVSINNQTSVVVLEDNQFAQFLQKRRNLSYWNTHLLINDGYPIKVNSISLALSSQYFSHLLSGKFGDLHKETISLSIPNNSVVIFEILLIYLALDYIVVPTQMGYKDWIELSRMAGLYCLQKLLNLCEQQLCYKVNEQNCNHIMEFALEVQMHILTMWCADFELKSSIKKSHNSKVMASKSIKKEKVLKQIFELLKFDIQQTKLLDQKLLDGTIKKKQSASTQGEKQNYQINYNE